MAQVYGFLLEWHMLVSHFWVAHPKQIIASIIKPPFFLSTHLIFFLLNYSHCKTQAPSWNSRLLHLSVDLMHPSYRWSFRISHCCTERRVTKTKINTGPEHWSNTMKIKIQFNTNGNAFLVSGQMLPFSKPMAFSKLQHLSNKRSTGCQITESVIYWL
jgi:hypothetical protein